MSNRIELTSNKAAYYAWILFFILTLFIYYIVFKKHGVEIQIDSTSYIRGALNMKAGLGFTHANTPINHYPCGLSFIYYVLMLIFPTSLYKIALYFNVILLACMGVMFQQLLKEYDIAAPVQVAGFIIFFLSPPVIDMGAKMLTELPTTFLILLSTLILVRATKKAFPWQDSLLIGIILGIGILIRFAMIGIIAGFACYLFWGYRNSLKKAILHALLIGIPGVLFSISYSTYATWRYHHPPVDREMIWHPITLKLLFNYIKTPLTWIVQYKHNSLIQVSILGISTLMLAIVLWQITNKARNTSANFLQRMIRQNKIMAPLFISLIYCVFLLASISLFDASTPVDTRILSIIAIYFYLGISLLLQRAYQFSTNKKISLILIFMMVFVLVWPTKTILSQRYKYPQCYNKLYWQNEARWVVNENAFKWIKPTCTIYTNSFSFWQLCNNKAVKRLPDFKNEIKQRNNEHFNEEINAIRNEIISNKAQLIFFYTMPSHSNKIKKPFVDSFFADTETLHFIPFEKGIIIEGKTTP